MAIEKKISVQTADGTADAYLYQPAENGNWPGVIQLTDLFGIRDCTRKDAARLADDGFLVLMPNIFYRTKTPPIFSDFPFKPGEERSNKLVGELRGPLTKDAVQRDGKAYADFLLKNPNVKGNKLGVVGYCMTASHAIYIGAALPNTIAAVAGFHGGGLVQQDANSPHNSLSQIKGQQYYGHASNDAFMTSEQIAIFEKALKDVNANARSETYPALHSWTQSDQAVYDKPSAERAYGELKEVLRAAG
jgi:carboxymethylenebutenolidase